VSEEDDMTTDAWLLKLVAACDNALEGLSPDDPLVAVLRADITDFRSTLHARLPERGDG
jgi:hypothetical protein